MHIVNMSYIYNYYISTCAKENLGLFYNMFTELLATRLYIHNVLRPATST